jgi:hypothetical protein
LVDSCSFFLLSRNTSTLEGCGVTKANQRHKCLTIFSGEQTTKVSSRSTERWPSNWQPKPLHKGRGMHPQLNKRLPTTPTKIYNQSSSFGTTSQRSTKKHGRNTNSFGESVDLCFFHRILKSQ